jgi:hypothetical protein
VGRDPVQHRGLEELIGTMYHSKSARVRVEALRNFGLQMEFNRITHPRSISGEVPFGECVLPELQDHPGHSSGSGACGLRGPERISMTPLSPPIGPWLFGVKL